MTYKSVYKHSSKNPEEFWRQEAKNVPWHKFPNTIFRANNLGSYDWYPDGEINMSYAALDYHLENGRGSQVALYYDSPVTKKKKSITYKSLTHRVSTFAGVLKSLGVTKGDTVIIYMPLIPEGVIAMLACSRIGAIHSVVFGGFAPHELQIRIDEVEPKVILTASCGIEFDRIIDYKALVDKGIALSSYKPNHVIVHVRPENPNCSMESGRDFVWEDIEKSASPADPVWLKGTDPLYILYTSGTTAKPKGILRRVGDHAVMLKFTMKNIYNTNPGEVYWAGSDIGWVVGHSYIVYGPLLQGCSTIIYEGKPVRTPDAGAFWRVISEYKVSTFFTAPTAFRAIKKEDADASLLSKHDISSLRTLFLAGERLDPPTYNWLQSIVKVPIIDNWWQTELGSPALSMPTGIETMPARSGSAGLPVPGYDMHIKNENGQSLPPNKKGNLTIKLPLPPGAFPTIWKNNARYRKSYLEKYPGFYLSGDEGYIDEDGYVYVMGRIDDIINVSGHRLSTGEMEELIGSHPAVAECAVVGVPDSLRGEVPMGLVVLKNNVTIEQSTLEKDLVGIIRENIGPIACFRHAVTVKRLPKTRSGKILRRTIRQIAKKGTVEPPSTIDDPAIIDEITNSLLEHKQES